MTRDKGVGDCNEGGLKRERDGIGGREKTK